MTSMGGLCPRPSSRSTLLKSQLQIVVWNARTLNGRRRILFLYYRRPITGAGQPLKGGLDMNRHTSFGSPYLLGFEHLERLLERTARNAGDAYPPYNIEGLEDGGIRITLAVAGFSQEELSVAEEDRQLVVRGRQAEVNGKTFLHRGIAARQFLRSFVLADGIEVAAAALENGLLKIDLARKHVQPIVRVVNIKTGGLP
jgi:HSP20 family molecular chaperone IbpA